MRPKEEVMIHIFITLGRIYRANPFRKHCDASAGVHVRLCRALGLPAQTGTGYGMVGESMMKPLGSKHF